MEVIIFKNPDGTCGIIRPANGPTVPYIVREEMFLPTLKMVNGKKTLVQVKEMVDIRKERVLSIEEIAKKDVPEGLSYRIVDDGCLPRDRYFRNAWTDDNPTGIVDVCLKKACEVHMDYIRNARTEEFIKMGFKDKLHPEIEAGLSKETRNKLKELRDIPQDVDLSKARDLEELKAIWPEQLKR